MPTYAVKTEVPIDRSKAEIERTLQRWGADAFMSGYDANSAFLAFRLKGRQIKFIIPMPKKEEFKLTPGGKWRTSDKAIIEAWEQGCRQRWRALALVIKAKLEAIDCGISTLEDEFMSAIMLPDGQTVGEWMKPQIEQVYLSGKLPPLLPGG